MAGSSTCCSAKAVPSPTCVIGFPLLGSSKRKRERGRERQEGEWGNFS